MKTRESLGQWLKSTDTWLLAALGALALLFFVLTWNYRLSAALFPRLVSLVVVALCAYQLGDSARAAAAGRLETREKSERAQGVAWQVTFLAVIAYFVLIPLVGFVLGTAVFFFAFPILAGYRRWVIVVALTISVTVLVEAAFGSLLHVPLPEGALRSLIGR